ncbi:MAG: GNAT family N-acetyltransferase [Solirubrobacteraceae bacterium]
MRVPTASPTIRPFREEDEAGVLELLTAALGPGPLGHRSPAFFRWKHRIGPFGPSLMRVAEAEGRIVGLRAFMRWRLRGAARTLAAVRAVDTATDPDYQRTGVFSALTTGALEDLEEDVALAFNTPNRRSLPGYLKLGWQVAGTVPVSIRVRRPIRFARGLASLNAGDPPPEPPPAARVPTAADVLADRDAISLLLAEAEAPRQRLATPRDPEYLVWRYASVPELDYRAVVEERGGRLCGLAIFRVRRRGPLWESTVAELIVRPGDRGVAGRLLVGVTRAAACDHVICAFPAGSAPARAAPRSGFLSTRRGVTLAVKPLRRTDPGPGRLSSWALSLGDLELL